MKQTNEYFRAYREKNRDKLNKYWRERARKKREENREAHNKYQCEYLEKNRDKINKQQVAAKIKREYGQHAVELKKTGKCGKCNITENLHIHHIDGKGSTTKREFRNNNKENLQLLCASCHAKIHYKKNCLENDIKSLA